MSELKLLVTITATGEVRDADGNLLNVEPIQATTEMTEDEARAAGLLPPTPESE